MNRFLVGFLLLICLALNAACSATHTGGSTVASYSGTVSEASLEAFQSTMYSFGQTQGCVMCHASIVNPQWMNPNLNMAYAFAAPLVNFQDPTASIYATFAGNNHCSNPICANPANDAVVQNLLIQWAAAELAQNGSVGNGSTLANPAFVTQALPIPTPLPLLTSGTSAKMQFDLSQLTPPVPALNNAILQINVLSFNTANNEYKVSNPIIVGATSPVTITGWHVYVRPASGSGLGTEDVNQGDLWAGESITVPVLALPNPVPTALTGFTPLINFALGIAAQSAADVMTFGFANIQ